MARNRMFYEIIRQFILLAIYHRWDDMFKLQDFLMNLDLNYKFYIRHYS